MKKLRKPTMIDMNLLELYTRRNGFEKIEPFTISTLPEEVQKEVLTQTAKRHRELFINRQQ
jgi:hypothetical protein